VRLALAGSVVFVLACLLVPQGLRSTALYSDVHVYHAYAHNMTSGQMPYRDFFDEYPPLAQPIILAARSVLLFKLLLTLCGVCIVWLLATVFRSGAAVAVFALSPLLVGSIYLNAYDLWPAFLLAAALALFVREKPMWGFAVLGAATAAKIYPAAVLPIALLFVPRFYRVRGLVWFAGVFVLAHVPFLILGPGGLRFSYTIQMKRGLELNSLGSSLLLVTAHRTLLSRPPGSLDVIGQTARVTAAISAVLVVAAVLFAAWRYAQGRLAFLTACAAAVTGFVAFDKVFSAQYVEWLAPLAPLAGLVAAAGTAVVLGLTHVVFSHRSALAEQRDCWILLVRNLSVVALFGWLVGGSGEIRGHVARPRATGGLPPDPPASPRPLARDRL
jgi:uncharacterized membrane protein